VDDVAVDAIPALRQRRHVSVEVERLWRTSDRMQMRQRIERGLADQEQMHQLAVVRQQCVVPTLRLRGARPPFVADAQGQRAPAAPQCCRGFGRERTVDDEPTVARLPQTGPPCTR
jgi:hypothetical protein